jgi:hypothetical protein
MRFISKKPSDPAPDAEWEVWYRDTFDRECPPSVEVKGRGLVQGLMELWARHLFETVRPEGGAGFSRFSLRWDQRPAIWIEGTSKGATQLRRWVFRNTHHTTKGYIAEAEKLLLQEIAVAHAYLVVTGESCEQILAAAATTTDPKEFERRLQSFKMPSD